MHLFLIKTPCNELMVNLLQGLKVAGTRNRSTFVVDVEAIINAKNN